MKSMNIWQLQEYAQQHGFNTGHFLAIGEKGIAEFKWIDAYFGLAAFRQKDGNWSDGFIAIQTLREMYGDDTKYIPTIGYDDEEALVDEEDSHSV